MKNFILLTVIVSITLLGFFTINTLHSESSTPVPTINSEIDPLSTGSYVISLGDYFQRSESPTDVAEGTYMFLYDEYKMTVTENTIKITPDPKTKYMFTFDGTDITIEFKGVSAPE
jgi:hypothetical protein